MKYFILLFFILFNVTFISSASEVGESQTVPVELSGSTSSHDDEIKPEQEKPEQEEPEQEEPEQEKPGTEEPETEEPGTEEPGTEEPGTEEPGTEEPGTEEPETEELETEEIYNIVSDIINSGDLNFPTTSDNVDTITKLNDIHYMLILIAFGTFATNILVGALLVYLVMHNIMKGNK